MSATPSRWRRLLVEGGVIVASILLAFAIDAWWGERVERAEVREMLVLVHAELEANRDFFETVSSLHARVVDSAFELLDYTGPDPSPADFERVPFLIGELWLRAANEPPSTGAVASLIASGSLSRIENAGLRAGLSRWPDIVQRQYELHVEIGEVRDFHDRMLLHVAQLDIDLANGMGDYGVAFREFVRRAPERSRFPSDYAGLLSDREFESGVTSKATLGLIGIELAAESIATIDELLPLIDEALR